MHSASRLMTLYNCIKFLGKNLKYCSSYTDGTLLQNTQTRLYGSCTLHIVWLCFLTVQSFMKINWTDFKLWSEHETTSYKIQNEVIPKGTCRRVMVLPLCTRMMHYVSNKYHESLSSYGADAIRDGQTDRWSRQKKISRHPDMR